jgi:hypothetical protein
VARTKGSGNGSGVGFENGDSRTDSRTDAKGIRIWELTHSSRLAWRYVHTSPAEAEESVEVLWRHLIGKNLLFASVWRRILEVWPEIMLSISSVRIDIIWLSVYFPFPTLVKTGDRKRDL